MDGNQKHDIQKQTDLSSKETFNTKKSLPSENCDEKFASTESMQSHVKKIHDEGKLHRCDLCSKTFGTANRLHIII